MTLAPELFQLNKLAAFSHSLFHSSVLAEIPYKNSRLPIQCLSFGSGDPGVPVLIIVGGVHGVERIGSQVVLAFVETLMERLKWDDSLKSGLDNLALHFIPVLNPVGLMEGRRSNGNGVDLMRNAPVDAEGRTPFLAGGHRISSIFPWYRGKRGELETETAVICDWIEYQTRQAPFTMVLDVHSGYGFHDYLWFPMAASREPIDHLPEMFSLRNLIKSTYPHLDYLYRQSCENERLLIPLTLEMGSWRWIKKNPLQIWQPFGLFHPIKPHRIKRVLRSHIVLMEFLIRAARSYNNWLPIDSERESLRYSGLHEWFVNE